MPKREPVFNDSKALDRKIKDQLDAICKLSTSLQSMYFNGASSAALLHLAQDIVKDVEELRDNITKYDEIEDVT